MAVWSGVTVVAFFQILKRSRAGTPRSAQLRKRWKELMPSDLAVAVVLSCSSLKSAMILASGWGMARRLLGTRRAVIDRKLQQTVDNQGGRQS